MRRFTFTAADLDAIRHDRYHHPHPRVQQKMEVLWLKSHGCTHEAIARLADVSRRTVQRYLDAFAAGGLERVRRWPWQGQANELAPHRVSLEEYFVDHPPRSARHRSATTTNTPFTQASACTRTTSQGRSPAGTGMAGQFTGAAMRSAPASAGSLTHSGNSRS